MMTKEMLEEKKESLEKSLEKLLREQMQIAEQISMHRGAVQYNQLLIKELEETEIKENSIKVIE